MKHHIQFVDVPIAELQRARELYKKDENRFEEYIDRLLEWNEKINVVSRNVSRETIREHVVHSLLPLSLNLMAGYNNWLDAGTGGGLPGVPMAISNPNLQITLNDNVRKKIRVVEDITGGLGLTNTKSVAISISLAEIERGVGIISKHAFKISKLLQLLEKKPWEIIILWKGVEDAADEINQLRRVVDAKIYRFNFGFDEAFYEGKGLVVLQKQG